MQNIITVFEKELKSLGETTKVQLQNIKVSYDRSMQAIESIANNIICDEKYGLYNRNFLDIRLLAELESIHTENHKSSLILIQITKSLARRITSDKNSTLISRAISKILQKSQTKVMYLLIAVQIFLESYLAIVIEKLRSDLQIV